MNRERIKTVGCPGVNAPTEKVPSAHLGLVEDNRVRP